LYKIYDSNLFFSNLLDNKFFFEKNNDIRLKELIQVLYQYDELKVKILFFLLWDIEDYLGVVNINHFKSYINMDLACLNVKNILNDIDYLNNIKIKLNSFDYLFYDLNFNYTFFNELHSILNDNKNYQKHIIIIENDLNLGFDRTLDCYNKVDNEEYLVIWITDYIKALRKE
jgi:hypothetical protein